MMLPSYRKHYYKFVLNSVFLTGLNQYVKQYIAYIKESMYIYKSVNLKEKH